MQTSSILKMSGNESKTPHPSENLEEQMLKDHRALESRCTSLEAENRRIGHTLRLRSMLNGIEEIGFQKKIAPIAALQKKKAVLQEAAIASHEAVSELEKKNAALKEEIAALQGELAALQK
ncbi:hypothetical protein NHQ30_008012 [Ciborinia camelliae]|nr:hypothetical protein NHQ30_008012 [Ciborinia camelliae]